MNSVLDDALERLRHTGPEVADGAPNHGPMAARIPFEICPPGARGAAGPAVGEAGVGRAGGAA